MDVEDTIEVGEATVCCDGGGGALGHPAVYLHFDESRVLVCPYCSRRFVQSDGAAGEGH